MTAPLPSPEEQAVIDRFGIFEPEQATGARNRKYGADPEALAWARSKVEAALGRVDAMALYIKPANPDKAEGYAGAAWRIRSLLIGGETCSVGAFDERMAAYYSMHCVHGHLLDDRSHRCGS